MTSPTGLVAVQYGVPSEHVIGSADRRSKHVRMGCGEHEATKIVASRECAPTTDR